MERDVGGGARRPEPIGHLTVATGSVTVETNPTNLAHIADQVAEIAAQVLLEQHHVEALGSVEVGDRRNEEALADAGPADRRGNLTGDLAIDKAAGIGRTADHLRDGASPNVDDGHGRQAHAHDPTFVGRRAGFAVAGVFGEGDGLIGGEKNGPRARRPPAVATIVGPGKRGDLERTIGRGVGVDRSPERLDEIGQLSGQATEDRRRVIVGGRSTRENAGIRRFHGSMRQASGSRRRSRPGQPFEPWLEPLSMSDSPWPPEPDPLLFPWPPDMPDELPLPEP